METIEEAEETDTKLEGNISRSSMRWVGRCIQVNDNFCSNLEIAIFSIFFPESVGMDPDTNM
jgi:hypothetical protein